MILCTPTVLHDLENVLRVQVLDNDGHFDPTTVSVREIQNRGRGLFDNLMASGIYDVSGMRLSQ